MRHYPVMLPLLLLWAAASPFPQFDAKVKAYVELVNRLDRQVGKLPDRASADEVHGHQRALAAAIAEARAGARQSEVFTPPERDAFVRLVREQTAGAQGATARKAIQEDNPKASRNTPAVKLAPNAPYPEGAPLSTVPPSILLRLPPLPKTLDYRFVGKALVLRDARANVIVDFVPNALP